METANSKISLVLEGGGMRGVYTAGVLDAFLEAGIEFDGVIGVSAGACHACSFLSRQKGRAYRVNVSYLKDWHYCSLRSWLTTGELFGSEMLFDTIPNKLDLFDYAAYDQNPTEFRAVVTNVNTGLPEYPVVHDLHQDIQWVRASSSLPLVSTIVKVNGKEYLDGGISDSIPAQASIDLGYDKSVIVMTQCKEYRKGPNKLMPLLKKKYARYPELLKCLENRHTVYNQSLQLIEDLQQQGKAFVIRPKDPVKIGRVEKDRSELHALYSLGLEDGRNQIEALKEFIKC